MKNLFLLCLLLLIPACADPPKITIAAECIGYDGIPINPSLHNLCCEGSPKVMKENADNKKCVGGIISNIADNINGAQTSLQMAAANISQTAAMLGVQVDLKAGPKTTTQKSNIKTADSFGANAPGAIERKGTPDLSALLDFGGRNNSGSAGSGSNGNSAGGGLGGAGGGSTSSGSAGGGNDAYGKGPNAKTGTSFGANSAEKAKRDGGDPTSVGNNLKVEGEQWGATGAKGPDADLNTASDDEGSANDPADYFSRIKKGDSLFAVVSNRYKIKQVKMNTK